MRLRFVAIGAAGEGAVEEGGGQQEVALSAYVALQAALMLITTKYVNRGLVGAGRSDSDIYILSELV